MKTPRDISIYHIYMIRQHRACRDMPWLNTGVLKSRPTSCNVCPGALLIVKPKHDRRGKYCHWKVNTGKVICCFIKSVTSAFFPVES